MNQALETNHQPQLHSISTSILLHLLPGILIGAVYFALVQPVKDWGYPSIAALNLAALLALIPFQAGFLLLQQKRTGAPLFGGIIRYQQKIPWHQYLLWVPVIFVSSGMIISLLTPLSELLEGCFLWIPDIFRIDMGLSGGYSKQTLIITYLSSFLLVTLIGPLIEECYFRGYLLPRMPDMGGWTPLVHSALFALYHTWTPWLAVSRTLALLPLVCIVRWKKNLALGMIAHCLLNSIDIAIGVAFLLNIS